MGAVPSGVSTDAGPPTAVPLRHFLVGIGLLVAGCLLGLGSTLGVAPGAARLAHVHVLLVGWVCVTIMGAMTQFVPVWSGTSLHSRRLASVQLYAVLAGVLAFAAALLTGRYRWLAPAGAALVVGFWTFAYNVGRTLAGVRPLDVTERHFALALAFFLAATALGFALAVDLSWRLFPLAGVDRAEAVGAHATLAVLGGVLATVVGALYQLASMFTQSDLHGVDHHLRRIEEAGTHLGVCGLAVGRLLSAPALARAGGVALAVSLSAFGVVVLRRLWFARVDRTPMLTRYALAVLALGAWAPLAAVAWLRDPLSRAALLGSPRGAHLLVFLVGFVVLGTLYHVVPFLVWHDRYADRLGLEDVPSIDDLYDHRVAAADFWATAAGATLLVAGEFRSAEWAVAAGGAAFGLGAVLFGANLLWVVYEHAEGSPVWAPGSDPGSE